MKKTIVFTLESCYHKQGKIMERDFELRNDELDNHNMVYL